MDAISDTTETLISQIWSKIIVSQDPYYGTVYPAKYRNPFHFQRSKPMPKVIFFSIIYRFFYQKKIICILYLVFSGNITAASRRNKSIK